MPSCLVLLNPTWPEIGSMHSILSPSSACRLLSMFAPRHDPFPHRSTSGALTARRTAACSPFLCLEPELAPVRLLVSIEDDFSLPAMTPSASVHVSIAALGPNRCNISAVNLIGAPIGCVWGLVSDYDHLSNHIINVVMSRPMPYLRGGGTCVGKFGQKGIPGFVFCSIVPMYMTEVSFTSPNSRSITLELVFIPDIRYLHC